MVNGFNSNTNKLFLKQEDVLYTIFGTAKIDNTNYYRITSSKENNNRKLLHRLIFERFYGKIPEGFVIHHKDGNKLNNCIYNLELIKKSEHSSLHNIGEYNSHYGKNLSQITKEKISEARNTSGYLNVSKRKSKRYNQGFIYEYKYSENSKRKTINSIDIHKLKAKVLAKGLPWREF